MAVTREALCPISKNNAMQCLAESDKGEMYADIAKPVADGFVPTTPMTRSALNSVLDGADGIICVCSDERLPGYALAFYDKKRDRWMRLKTDRAKIAEYVTRVSVRTGARGVASA